MAVMNTRDLVYFDPDTVSLLRATLADAWASLDLEQQASTSQSIMAEGILNSAAQGERNPERLREAALESLAA
jgi:hypothetical protein